ncbi:MAG: M99 family carboxypeptidase catalytic domain-containing protein, partial [Thermodesulfobacteriota bacterium]|nr:M99 family carboxypeptidase catalytic domain-containing protein [Thermodesulfobacteriota bacterium]
ANPKRYGQSIIADCAEYIHPRTGRKLELEKIADQVVTRINAQIENSKYHFHFMNTRTSDKKSPYAEQRSSATYYALTRHGIPAFGVETSKNLPTMEMKVRQHNLAVNAFMELFGLEPEQPRIYLVPPKLKYLIVSINNRVPAAVADGETLFVNSGETIEVTHVEANYDRGLSVDIQGLGTINDFRRVFTITRPTFITAQKDHIKFGRVAVALRSPGPEGPRNLAREAGPLRVRFFVVEVEGRRCLVADGERLEAVDGDTVKLVDVITEGPRPAGGLTVNFKGFVSDARKNTGEDRGYVIDTATDLMKRYSLSKKERVYAVVAELGKRVLARMTIRLNKPRLDYVILRHNGGPRLCLRDGESLKIDSGDKVQVLGLKTNVQANRGVRVKVRGRIVEDHEPGALLAFKAGQTSPLTIIVTREGLTLGKIVLKAG